MSGIATISTMPMTKPISRALVVSISHGAWRDIRNTAPSNRAMAIMIQNNIRHTPVVEESGLVGLLSMRDVVRVLVKNLKAENHYLKDMIGGKFEV